MWNPFIDGYYMSNSKDVLYTARWFAAKIRDSQDLVIAKNFSLGLIEFLTTAIGDYPIPRTNDKGDVVGETPKQIEIPVGKSPIPKSEHIFPRSTRVELDPDRNGVMPFGRPRGVVIHYTLS